MINQVDDPRGGQTPDLVGILTDGGQLRSKRLRERNPVIPCEGDIPGNAEGTLPCRILCAKVGNVVRQKNKGGALGQGQKVRNEFSCQLNIVILSILDIFRRNRKGVDGISSVADVSPDAMSRAIRRAESVPV